MIARSLVFFLFAIAAVAQNRPAAAATPSNLPPLTGEERVKWVLRSTFGPTAIATHVAGAGIQTWRNRPEEWGPHWDGFGRRLGSRSANTAIRATTEASLGAIWGEDPRYYRAVDKSFMGRVWSVTKQVVIAHNRHGDPMPAYARYVAYPGAAFAQNAWMPDSRNGTKWAVYRTGWGFAGRLGSNAFKEFWPDIRKKVFHK